MLQYSSELGEERKNKRMSLKTHASCFYTRALLINGAILLPLQQPSTIDNIGSRMDWKRDHVRALNQHKPCRRVLVARELQLPMLYWPILWKFGGKELTDLLTLACM